MGEQIDNEKSNFSEIYERLLTQKEGNTIENLMFLLYNVKTQDDYLLWFRNNKHLPIYTQKRVLDCYLHVTGKDFFTLTDDIIELFQKIINNFWKCQLKNKTKLTKVENNVIKELLNKYHEKYKDKWLNIELHTDKFKSFLFGKLKSNN